MLSDEQRLSKNAKIAATLLSKRPALIERTCSLCGCIFKLARPKRRPDQAYCSRKCSATVNQVARSKAGGRASIAAQAETRRSKNEKFFAELCEQHFEQVICNEPMFNGWDADVILPKLQIAVLWNGIWHYEQVTKSHSVAQVQNRDQIKIKEIIACGYRPYVIKDLGRFDEAFVKAKFAEFLLFAG